MHPINNIVEEIVSDSNLNESFDYVMRGNKRKRTRRGRYMLHNREQIIEEIRKTILNGTFKIDRYFSFKIKEREKERNIQCVRLETRVLLNAVMKIVEKYLIPRMIIDTAASIKGRGLHYLRKRLRNGIVNHKEETKVTFQSDFKKCYESIPQDKMYTVVKHYIKDPLILHILKQCIYMLPKGLSIGLRSSQCLANLYISHYIGHPMKEKAKCKHLRIYCDNITFQASSYYELTGLIKEFYKFVEDSGLTIKPDIQLFETSKRPVDALGYKTYSDGHTLIRNHIKKRFAKKWKRIKSFKRKVELIGSFYGICKHANTNHLFKKLTGISMKNFSELGLTYCSKNGKEMIEAPRVSIMDLINQPIVIEKIIENIETVNGNRAVVAFSCNGEKGKFFTGSDEIITLICQARDLGELPFQTTILRKSIDKGKFKLILS